MIVQMFLVFMGMLLHQANIVRGSLQCAAVYETPNGIALDLSCEFPSGIAIAQYSNRQQETGWNELRITTSGKYSAEKQAYAAGYVEAYFTHVEMSQYWRNYAWNEYSRALFPSAALRDFMIQQHAWAREQVIRRSNTSRYWKAMGWQEKQWQGLVDGYTQYAQDPLLKSHAEEFIYLLNSVGDLEDLNIVFNHTAAPAKDSSAPILTDCTAFIRLSSDRQNLLFGHSTWRAYYAMIRVFKQYDFEFTNRTIRMSSSPGLLHSKDDYYQLSNGLVIVETTNSIFNLSLYDFLDFKSVLSWQRAMISNWLASNPLQWVNLFRKFNSGTYNNQWMILNTRGVHQAADMLWIIEQIPNHTEAADVTHLLIDQGYWSSFNIPYFQSIYNASGYHCPQDPTTCSYQENARAKILRRDSVQVETISQLQQLMQSNEYRTDVLSSGSPLNAISSRYDLLPKPKRRAFGGIDSKVSSLEQYDSIYMISGPTHQSLLPFEWNQCPEFQSIRHNGVPDRFNFNWTVIRQNNTGKVDISLTLWRPYLAVICLGGVILALVVARSKTKSSKKAEHLPLLKNTKRNLSQ